MAHPMALEGLASGMAVSAATASVRSTAGLTIEQWILLKSIISVLTPGAAVCGACMDALERRLNGPLSRMVPAMQQGLAAMDSACVQQTGQGLIDLAATERGKFVRELRSGHKLTAFFQLIASSCAISS